MKPLASVLLAATLASASAQTSQSALSAIAGLVQTISGTNSQNGPTALSNAASAAQTYAGTNGGISVGPGTSAANQSPVAAIAGLVQTLTGTNAQDGKSALAAAASLVQGLAGAKSNPLASLGGKPAIDFRELKSALPDTLAGLRRTNVRGEKTGALGAEVSFAEGTYGTEGGPRFVVKISDLGALGPVAAFAGMAWAGTEIESEGDQGYERTTRYHGQKGLEKYSTTTRSGTANVAVANRFVVEITGRGIEPQQLKAAAEGLDYAALERLASP